MIQNLVTNAIRYTREGLVKLRCLHEEATIRIEVLDTGIGIRHDRLGEIFEEFYQVEQGDGKRREGLGLGLSIVRRLGHLLEHPVDVLSEPGRGSCFAITVPRSEAPLGSTSSTGLEIASMEPRRGRILLIDDEPAVADASRMMLELEGHEVFVAEVKGFVERTDVDFDLIMSDFHLGQGTTGIDAVRAVRKTTGRTIPAIIVTGDTSSQMTPVSSQLLSCQMLSKPVDVDALLDRIQQLLRDAIRA